MMLEASDLAVARGGAPVLEGLSLALAPGRALVLRGPNGCGKTTLLRTLAGLQPPLAGQIAIAPETVALAGHADGLKPTLTAAENLRFWAAIHGAGAAAAEAALHEMALAPVRDRRAQNLSAGQKRRLGLARLLVTGRPLWLLDEPTVSLDAASVALFAEVVRAHLATGGAALIATHADLGLIEAGALDLAPYKARPPQQGGAGGVFDEALA